MITTFLIFILVSFLNITSGKADNGHQALRASARAAEEVVMETTGTGGQAQCDEPASFRTIDFSTAGDGKTELKHGDYVELDEWHDSFGVSITASATRNGYTPGGKARIFDTGISPTEDADLESPNERCGGTGIGEGGEPGSPGENCEPQGNVLIIQESNKTEPDDNAYGGTFTFTFEQNVTLLQVGLMDMEGSRNYFVIYKADGSSIRHNVDGLGDNSIQTVAFDQMHDVVRFTLTVSNSCGIRYLEFCSDNVTPPNLCALPPMYPNGTDVQGCGKISRSQEESAFIELGMKATLPFFALTGTVSFTAKKHVNLGVQWCDNMDEPLVEQVGGECVLAKDAKVKCHRECTISTTETAKGNVQMFTTSTGVETSGTTAGSRAASVGPFTVPKGSPLSNIRRLCIDKLGATQTGTVDALCNEAKILFLGWHSWKYAPSCGTSDDGDAECEATDDSRNPIQHYYDCWQNYRCEINNPNAKVENRAGVCKLYGGLGWECEGRYSSTRYGGSFLPCDHGLNCQVTEEPSVSFGFCWRGGKYHCKKLAGSTYDGPGPGKSCPVWE